MTEIGRMLTRDQDNVDNVKGVGGHEEDVDVQSGVGRDQQLGPEVVGDGVSDDACQGEVGHETVGQQLPIQGGSSSNSNMTYMMGSSSSSWKQGWCLR